MSLPDPEHFEASPGTLYRAFHGSRDNADITSFSCRFSQMDVGERGIYFTDSLVHANAYATGWGEAGPEHGGAIYPVLLRIGNLYEVTAYQWGLGQGMAPEDARAAGFDGYLIRGQEGGNTFIVFDGAQVLPAVRFRPDACALDVRAQDEAEQDLQSDVPVLTL